MIITVNCDDVRGSCKGSNYKRCCISFNNKTRNNKYKPRLWRYCHFYKIIWGSCTTPFYCKLSCCRVCIHCIEIQFMPFTCRSWSCMNRRTCSSCSNYFYCSTVSRSGEREFVSYIISHMKKLNNRTYLKDICTWSSWWSLPCCCSWTCSCKNLTRWRSRCSTDIYSCSGWF